MPAQEVGLRIRKVASDLSDVVQDKSACLRDGGDVVSRA